MREIKMALLEADVNYKVVRDFIKTVSERAVGSEVLESLLPGQQIVKIVHEEMIALMGTTQAKLTIAPKPPTVIMMVGLQGAGKTTHTGKIAAMYKSKGKNPLLVACDVYRPAAIDQLKVVGESIGIPVFSMGTKISPVEIAKAGVEHAKKNGHDMVIIDTAGRLHIDEALMEELGIEVRVGRIMDALMHTYPDRDVLILFYGCEIIEGEPEPIDCHAVAWAKPGELTAYDFAGGDMVFVRRNF
jgi:signal recognition particle subunit SRP54